MKINYMLTSPINQSLNDSKRVQKVYITPNKQYYKYIVTNKI